MFSQIKLILASLTGIVVLVFGFLFQRRGSKIKEQEVKLQVKDEEIEVQKQVHNSEMNNVVMKSDVKDKLATQHKEDSKVKEDITSKVNNTPDGVEYEVKL